MKHGIVKHGIMKHGIVKHGGTKQTRKPKKAIRRKTVRKPYRIRIIGKPIFTSSPTPRYITPRHLDSVTSLFTNSISPISITPIRRVSLPLPMNVEEYNESFTESDNLAIPNRPLNEDEMNELQSRLYDIYDTLNEGFITAYDLELNNLPDPQIIRDINLLNPEQRHVIDDIINNEIRRFRINGLAELNRRNQNQNQSQNQSQRNYGSNGGKQKRYSKKKR